MVSYWSFVFAPHYYRFILAMQQMKKVIWLFILSVVFSVIVSVIGQSCSYQEYLEVKTDKAVLYKILDKENNVWLLWHGANKIDYLQVIEYTDTNFYWVGMQKDVFVTNK